MDKDKQNNKLYEFLPIISFLVIYFFMQIFEVMEATKISLSVSVSFITFLVMVNIIKDEKEFSAVQIRQLNFYTGILSVMLILVIGSGFLSWYRLVSNLLRSAIPLFLLLVYFILLFRSMRILAAYRIILAPKKQT
jgi:hypothetical protein